MSNLFKVPSTFKAIDNVKMVPRRFLESVKNTTSLILIVSSFFYTLPAIFKFFSFEPVRLILALFPFEMPTLPEINIKIFLALAFLAFPFWAVSSLILGFVGQKLMRAGKFFDRETNIGSEDLLEYLDYEATGAMKAAMRLEYLPFQRILLYRILKSRRLDFAFKRLCVNEQDLERELLADMKAGASNFSRQASPELQETNRIMREHILERAAQMAVANKERQISVFAIFMVLADEEEKFQKMMDSLQLLKEDVESVLLWQMRMETYRKNRARFWERENLRREFATSPAEMLIGGYTVALDEFSRNIALYNPLKSGGVVLHPLEIEQVEEALIKQQGSGMLLVGETGSGRKSIVYNFANRMSEESAPPALKMMRILEVNMVALIGSNPDKAVLAGVLERVFQEAIKAKNVILVIPQIHNYIGRQSGKDAVASIDISGVVGSYLNQPGFRLIGITTYEGLHQSIEASGEIASKFSKIEVSPVSMDDTMRVLKEESLRREIETGIFIPIASLKEIVKLCDYFLGNNAFPQKAINLLDDLISNKLSHGRVVNGQIMPADVDAYFSHKYNVPAGAAGQKEKDTLLNLEDRIHEGLINQKEAVEELANALRRARAEIKKRKRTIGNFLFIGPTGVGKTETAKQLAKVYFGSEKNMIRLNMSEYQTIESIEKLIGNATTPGFLTTAVRDSPFSLVLIDEIEKAHPGLLNIFLSVFDEGEMSDGIGRAIDFKHTIIIATSNAGAEYIKEAVDRGSSLANLKNSFVDNLLRRNIFKPEFLNRFDALVLYRPLNVEEMQQVAELILRDIKEELHKKRIEFLITSELTKNLASLGFDPAFGGRAMRRVVQDKVENTLAKAVLGARVKAGDTCEFDCITWELLVGEEERAAYHNRKEIIVDEVDPRAECLLHLEDLIHEGLINQKEAVTELASAMRRAHANLKESKRTIGNFLFLGPTGVGKTETAKQLAKVYYGSAKNMIRLNMAEYQNVNSIDKLIGNLQSPGLLTTQITERPQSLVLIDEIEKASPQVLNLFLSVFDDGELADGTGQMVNFKDTIIIATSNAGAAYIKEAIEGGIPLDGQFKKTFVDRLLQEGKFTPEFINRFDAVSLYRSLVAEEMKQVAVLMLKDIQNGLAAKGIVFQIDEVVADELVKIGFDPIFGGRAMRRAVQDKIENALANALLARSIRRGDTVRIDPTTWQAIVVATASPLSVAGSAPVA